MVNLNGKNVLITGGSGFIGSNFIDLILNRYHSMNILNLDKLGVGSRVFSPDTTNNKYKHLKIDIRDLAVSSFGYTKYDYIFHFAAESHVDRSIKTPYDFIENNVMGTVALLEYIREHQPQARLINISTDEVYGHLEIGEDSFTEISPLKPRSPYSASKASSDLLVQSYNTTYGLDAITTRCCNNYGPWQNGEKLIPTIINSVKSGKKIPVYGNGQNIREWIYVDDHNKSILEIAENGVGGSVYNIGSGVELSNLELIQKIVEKISPNNWEDCIEFVEDRKGHDFRYSIESLKYFREFNPINFDEGLSKTIDHYTK